MSETERVGITPQSRKELPEAPSRAASGSTPSARCSRHSLPALAVHRPKPPLLHIHAVVVIHEDNWYMSATIIRPQGLNKGQVAKATHPKVNEDDIRRRLSDATESLGFVGS
jgi:hypothetical protein